MSNNEWDSVTVVGSKARPSGGGGPRATVAKSQGAINQAKRSGNVVSIDKKYNAGGNSKGDPEGQRLTKVDRENEVAPPPKVDMSVGKAIQQGRQEKKLTQKELATKINEKPQVVNDYEAGRAVPNQQVLGKMERVIGLKLRGKDIGSPLGGPKKK